jgi:hypothetical protein
MPNWNPSAPNTIGLEWDVATESVTPLSSTNACAAWLCASTVAETISTIYVPLSWTGPSTGYGKLAIDVYDLADTGAGAPAVTSRYAPNTTQANNNLFAPYPWSSVTTTAHTYVDEEPYADSDYLAFASSSSCRFEFGSAAFTGSVQSVAFEIRAMGYSGGAPRLNVQLYKNGAYKAALGTLAPPADSDDAGPNFPRFTTYTLGPFTTNPDTGLAWTAADVASFDTAGTGYSLAFVWQSGLVGVSYVSMVVKTAGVDKRKATGSTATQTTLPSGFQTNTPVTLASSWSKAAATNYLLVARRLEDPAGKATTLVPQPVYLATAASPANGKSYSTAIDASGFLTAVGTGDATKTYPFWLGTSGGAISVDSQPYWDLAAKPCHTSSTLKQGVAGASAQAYKAVRAMVAYSAALPPTADLVVKLKRTSDNVQLGGNGTVTVAAAAATATTGTVVDATYGSLAFKLVSVDLASSGTLAAATDYYLEFTSSSSASNPWFVLMLDATASHALTGNQTYQGSTDQATVAGTGIAQGDFLARIGAAPAAPSSITVTNTTATINATTLDYAAISWVNGGSLGSAFARWEIERSEDGGTTWSQAGTISTEATVSFADYYGRRSNPNKYRVRIVRSDGVTSDWTTQTGTVTPAAVAGARVVFTSNAAPGLTVGYVPDGNDAAYDFLSASEAVQMRLHARDFTATFKPLEQRGIAWTFTLQVWVGQTAPPAGSGVAAFSALRALAESSTTTEVCMHTGDGERFYGAIVVPSGNRSVAEGIYLAPVTFTQSAASVATVAL